MILTLIIAAFALSLLNYLIEINLTLPLYPMLELFLVSLPLYLTFKDLHDSLATIPYGLVYSYLKQLIYYLLNKTINLYYPIFFTLALSIYGISIAYHRYICISEERIGRLTKELPFVKGIISDASNVKELPDSSFDFVICSQLVEHVEDDDMLVQEIRRLLRVGGLAYISSVIKKWYGVYFYFRDGSFRLDPTHVREYSSVDEFVSLIANNGFEIVDVKTHRVMFPLLDLIIRLFIRIGLLEPNVRFYQQHKVLSKIRRVRMPVVGYRSIEVLAK